MALTEDLSIYKAMYDLTLALTDARSKFDKPYKYVVGDKMVERALDCLTLIHFANEDRRKGARVEHLDKFLIEFDILKTLIMICRDRMQFKKQAVLADVFMRAAEVENQAGAWRRSAAKASASKEAQKESRG